MIYKTEQLRELLKKYPYIHLPVIWDEETKVFYYDEKQIDFELVKTFIFGYLIGYIISEGYHDFSWSSNSDTDTTTLDLTYNDDVIFEASSDIECLLKAATYMEHRYA